jgi:glycerol-3-phosphate acyltransferase PlsY
MPGNSYKNMILPLILVVCGYLLGSLLPANLFFRIYKKKFPLELGEKPSTFAVLRHIGFLPALCCLIYDMGKGFLPVFLALEWHVPLLWLPLIAIAPVAGHNWPFLRWNQGGWGLAAAGGALLALGGLPALAGLVGIPFIFIFPNKRGVGFCTVMFPVVLGMMILTHKPWQVISAAVAVMVLAIIRRLTGEKKQNVTVKQVE